MTARAAMLRCVVVPLAALSLHGCALMESRDTEETASEARPGRTRIPDLWTAPEWDTGEVDDGWVALFEDGELETLVDEAITRNPNLRVASARVERAERLVLLAEAALLPLVGLGAEAGALGRSAIPAATFGSGGLAIGWEAEVWGRIRAGSYAAELDGAAARADLEGARLSLAGQTAKAWFLAQELRMQVQLARETLGVLSELASGVRAGFRAGRLAGEDVDLAETKLAAARESLAGGRVAEARTLRALELLLGRDPSASLETSGQLVAVPPSLPKIMSSKLFDRRPDFTAAERRVARTFGLEEQTELARMPRFTFSGGLDGSTALVGIAGDFLAGVRGPVYAQALQIQIAIASADQKAALATYAQAAVRGLGEVETALFNDHILSEREHYLTAQVKSNRRALQIHRRQLLVGKTSAQPVLRVQARYVGSQVLLTRVRGERLAQRVNLHLALGGGLRARWE